MHSNIYLKIALLLRRLHSEATTGLGTEERAPQIRNPSLQSLQATNDDDAQ